MNATSPHPTAGSLAPGPGITRGLDRLSLGSDRTRPAAAKRRGKEQRRGRGPEGRGPKGRSRRPEPPGRRAMMVHCAGCERPILDRFLLNVLDRAWHIKCVQCCECKTNLSEKCFSREGNLYCKNDFFR